MKKRLLTLLLALVGLTTTAVAENYGIKIGGVAVTSDNYTNITSSNFPAVTSGYVTYDPSTRTLTLIYANIAGTISFLNNSAGFTLSLTKNTVNVVSGNSNNALYVDRVPLTISGGGTLMVSSNTTNCIYLNYNASNDYTLSIENSTVIASGTAAGIWCPSTYGTLNIDNSTVMATGLQGGSVRGMKAVTLTGSELHMPYGAAWSETSHAVCDADGTTLTSTVVFVPSTSSVANPMLGDMNVDGRLTVADVTALVNLILNGGQQQAGHWYVDLGLPSGTKWATCNIGADNPWNYGDYFAWGETVPYGGEDMSNTHNYNYANSYTKTKYDWHTYKWCDYFTGTSLTKYCNDSSYGYNGFTDNTMELEQSDDAAYVNWGSKWRTPSKEQFEELINSEYTTVEQTTVNGVNGHRVTSKLNGNSIFLPAAGYRGGTQLYSAGESEFYFSRTLSTSEPSSACYLYNSQGVTKIGRDSGLSVRPVRKQQ